MKKFLNLGLQPLANSYIKKNNLKSKEKKFKLVVGFNPKNFLVSILNTVPKEKMFNKDYLNSVIDENFYLKLYKEIPNLKNNLKKSQFIDIYFLKLQRALKYKDRISMSYGIESRIPFLDHHFAKYCFNRSCCVFKSVTFSGLPDKERSSTVD